MTAYTDAARVKHATLVANTVDTVTLDATLTRPGEPTLEVLNRSTVDPIYFRIDGTNPTVLGNDCDVVMPGTALPVPLSTAASVKLISAGAAPYSVKVR